jgi:hypothetical protein
MLYKEKIVNKKIIWEEIVNIFVKKIKIPRKKDKITKRERY